MEHSSHSRGFTLIELLVVIAIIGILSAVVLANLSTARQKGSDAAIRTNVDNARAQAELFYDAGKTYSGVCTSGTGIVNMVNGASTTGSANVVCYDTSNHPGTDSWVLSAQLKLDPTQYYCVDNTSTSTVRSSQVAINATGC